MSEGETPLTDKASFHRDNGFARLCEIVVPADFARDLERKLAEARTALEDIATLAPFSDNSIELRKAREALARIDAVNRAPASSAASGIQG
jgi:hypothetical protein